MTGPRRTSGLVRGVVALVTSVLLVATAVVVSRARVAPEEVPLAEPTTTATSPAGDPTGDPTPTPGVGPAPEILTSPELAEAEGAPAVIQAGRAAAAGPWADLGHEQWPTTDRPVYVVRGTLSSDRREVTADVAIAVPATRDADELVLRLLPGSRVLEEGDLNVVVRRDGAAAPHQVDRSGARLLVSLDPPVRAGEATLLRIRLDYRLLDRAVIPDDGGPAGFGLLARSDDVSVLGHWLPLLTVPGDDGAMVPWGDVGGFPPAVWSLILEADADVVTGGTETRCPARIEVTLGCVWSRGVALRDVAVVAYDDMAVSDGDVSGVRLRSVGPGVLSGATQAAFDAAAASLASYADRLGPLPWNDVEVTAAPLSGGVAGMEFPGLLVIGTGVYGSMRGGFGAAVVAHEIAHQWFHALVGNGSLSSPVVDESLAQYLSYLAWEDEFGPEAARDYARQLFARPYAEAREAGMEAQPPAQPLEAFSDADAYGALVYGRAALAWIAAEQEVGRDQVEAALAAAVRQFGLEMVSAEEFVAFLTEQDERLGAVVRRYWMDAEPIRDLPLDGGAGAS